MEHFYGGTRAGTIGNPDVTVRLGSLEGPTDPLKSTGTWITSSQDFRVGALLVAKGSAARIVRSGALWKVFTTFHGCAAGRAASWGDAAGDRGMAALQAQAVAARSYAQAGEPVSARREDVRHHLVPGIWRSR